MIPDDARFRKIKHNPKDGLTEVEYETPVKGDHDEHSHRSRSAPHPDFTAALQALAPAVIEIAELKGVATADDVDVRTVSLSYNKNDTVGVIITAMRQLKRSGPMLVNTPLKLLEGLENTPEEQLISDDAALRIEELIGQTRLFLNGKRAQIELALDGPPRSTGPLLYDEPAETLSAMPFEANALKAALILSGLAARPGPEAFDRLDRDVPETQRTVFLGRAPDSLLLEMESGYGGELFEIATSAMLGCPLEEGDNETLERLATAIATHGDTLAPYFEPMPFQTPAEDPTERYLPTPVSEEQWTQLSRGQLLDLVKRASADIAFAVLPHLVSERAARVMLVADLLEHSLLDIQTLIAFSIEDGQTGEAKRPALLDALEEKWTARSEPDVEPRIEDADTGEFEQKETTVGEEEESLAAVVGWLDYKVHCNRFGIKVRKADFDALMASRAPIADERPGYRDPKLRDEIAARREAAQSQTRAARARLPEIPDGDAVDLLGG